MYKKRWYDGLNDIYEGKDEFEIKFGCFGGDGGGSSSGPTSTPDAKTSSPTTGFRGEQSAASPSNRGYSGPTGVGIGPGSTGTPSGDQTAGMTAEQAQANQNISDNIAAAISANQAVNNPLGSINDMFSAPPSAPVSQNVSAVSNAPSVTGLSGFNTGLSNYSGFNTGVPTGLNISPPTSAQDVMAQATDITSGLPGISIGPGTLTGDISPAGKSVSLGYSIPFAKGGAVNQGIGSVFPYPRRR